eukprot:TRINITY_DN72133_c0_g1_i1.p1 TRINITY_DN72133_c0_g1~~TRINITY_DN72133_c0_g1_i1.p1  ORF type:complete len:944 (-),score=73.80 TRINITY_DN72133_c0_g1_i1:26-2596(-)
MGHILMIIIEEILGIVVQKPPIATSSSSVIAKTIAGFPASTECASDGTGRVNGPPDTWVNAEVWIADTPRIKPCLVHTHILGAEGYIVTPGLRTFRATVEKARQHGLVLQFWTSLLAPDIRTCCFSSITEIDTVLEQANVTKPTYDCPEQAPACDGGWVYTSACNGNRSSCIPVILGEAAWNLHAWVDVAQKNSIPLAFLALGYLYGNKVKMLHARNMSALFYWWEPDQTFLDIDVQQVLFEDSMLTIKQYTVPVKLAWKGLRELEYANPKQRGGHSAGDSLLSVLQSARISTDSLKDVLMSRDGTTSTAWKRACTWLRNKTNVEEWKYWLPTGFACDSVGRCGLCEPGRYSRHQGADNCSACKFGQYQPDRGSDRCLLCLPGTYASEVGQTACKTCRAGTVAVDYGARECSSCEPGEAQPLTSSRTCLECPVGKFAATSGQTSCSDCGSDGTAVDALPGAKHPSQCPQETNALLIAVVVATCLFIVVAVILVYSVIKKRWVSLLRYYCTALDVEDNENVEKYETRLKRHLFRSVFAESGGITLQLKRLKSMMFKKHSLEAGVSATYIISQEFHRFACDATSIEDPTFLDLKVIFRAPMEVGGDVVCQRDGLLGCALIDTLDSEYRKRCTHFLSWTWKYHLSTVQGSLSRWLHQENFGVSDSGVFFWMCFFCNNQYRLNKAETTEGLVEVFQSNLGRIRNMVAILDTWEQPTYFTRIWTIFEQYTALKLNIRVSIILPPKSAETLVEQIDCGKLGIFKVQRCISTVDAELAQASVPADEVMLKKLISEGVDGGFTHLNYVVRNCILEWVGQQVQFHIKEMVDLKPVAGTHSSFLEGSEHTGHYGSRMFEEESVILC